MTVVFGNEVSRQCYERAHVGERVTMSSQSQKKISNFQPAEKLFKKYMNKINVEKYEGPQLPMNVANHLIESNRKFEADR